MPEYIDKAHFMDGDSIVKSVPIQDTEGRSLISAAQNTANTANTNAGKAQTTANNAQSAANAAQETADSALARSGTPGILVIGDSNLMGWGGVNVWAATVKSTYPGFFDYDFDGGAGFGTSAHTFQSILTRKAGNMSADDRNNIDIIAVFGGVNDRTSSGENIIAGMQSFATIAKTNFPNACVKLFGMFTHIDIITDWLATFNVLQLYRSCSLYGGGSKTRAVMTYITNSEYVTHRYDIFQDGVHLTQIGQTCVLEKAVDGIINGSVSVAYQSTQTIKDNMQLVVEMINNITTIKVVGKANVNIPTGNPLRSVDVATIPKILINPVTLDLAFACGFENEMYLGIMPFAGDIQFFSPSTSNMTVVARLYANTDQLKNWVVENVTARGCNVSICTDLL